jgi:hypothetical protein
VARQVGWTRDHPPRGPLLLRPWGARTPLPIAIAWITSASCAGGSEVSRFNPSRVIRNLSVRFKFACYLGCAVNMASIGPETATAEVRWLLLALDVN